MTELPTLTPRQRMSLIESALRVRERAHAPYSKFLVGAALLAEDGREFAGCNVENMSYGLTICAERNAVFHAVAEGQTKFLAMALATSGGHMPCGACRQVLAEFCPDLRILIVNAESPADVRETKLSVLLPGRFEFTAPT